MAVRILKDKTCRNCKTTFTPTMSLQVVCGHKCAVTYTRTKALERREKAYRAETRRRRVASMTVSDWTKKVQQEFNLFIRTRDMANNEPCISCQRHITKKVNAGHFRPTSTCPQLRFSETQVFLQCEKCNSRLSGNLIPYRENLIKKIGLEAVEEIESNNETVQYRIPDLIELLAVYKAKNKALREINPV